jgi:hypothetical protein
MTSIRSARLDVTASLHRGQRVAIETLTGTRVFGRVEFASDRLVTVKPSKHSRHTRTMKIRRVDIAYIVDQG